MPPRCAGSVPPGSPCRPGAGSGAAAGPDGRSMGSWPTRTPPEWRSFSDRTNGRHRHGDRRWLCDDRARRPCARRTGLAGARVVCACSPSPRRGDGRPSPYPSAATDRTRHRGRGLTRDGLAGRLPTNSRSGRCADSPPSRAVETATTDDSARRQRRPRVTPMALFLAVVLAAQAGTTIAILVFVALLVAGVITNAERPGLRPPRHGSRLDSPTRGSGQDDEKQRRRTKSAAASKRRTTATVSRTPDIACPRRPSVAPASSPSPLAPARP